MAYHRYHGVNTRIVRIFNTYGPRMRMRDGRALPTFMRQALFGQPLTVYGSGWQTRSFTYVDDTVEGIVRLLYSGVTHPINIGSQEEITIMDFAQEIIKLTNSSSIIEHQPLPEDDPKNRQPDITLARQLLGWEPKVSRTDGLTRTLAYVRERLQQQP